MKPALLQTLLSNSTPISTLPQNLMSVTPTLQEDFETLADFAAITGTRAANTTQFKSGTQSIKTQPSAGSGSGSFRKTVAWNLAAVTTVRLQVYIHDLANTTNLIIYFSTDALFAHYYVWQHNAATLHGGWNALNMPTSGFTAFGTPSWANITRFQCRITSAVDGTAASFDQLQVFTTTPTPAVLVTFDDTYDNIYTHGYSYMRPRRIPATVYQITNYIDLAGGWITSAHLDEMYSGGWDIANHTMSHPNLATISQAECEAELSGAKAVLDGFRWTRAGNHVAYPVGNYDADTIAAMTATGMLTGRTILETRQAVLPPGDNYQLEIKYVRNTVTLAQAKAFIDDAIAKGTVCILLFHSLVASPSVMTEWGISDFRALMDYILQVEIQPITISQFYALQSGSVNVQRPAW